MHFSLKLKGFLLLLGMSLGFLFSADGAEYFVSPSGKDSHAGTSREAAFQTIQHGVNALAPGDTLTITPGEYSETVSRKGLGAPGSKTIIRAEIPGTVVLRGDVRAPEFHAVKGLERVYEAEFKQAVQTVNEVDSLKPLIPVPTAEDVSFVPGSYYHNTATGKLLISTTDLKPAGEHSYTLSVIGENGLFLDKAVGVVIDGLAVAGFNTSREVGYIPGSFSIWGILLLDPADCVVRNCTAFLNGGGINIKSRTSADSNNVIEYCTAYGNDSPFNDSGGNIAIFSPKSGVIRHCLAYGSTDNGLRLYGQGMEGVNAIEDSIAWGNKVDLFIKGGGALGTAKRSVAVGAGHIRNAENVLVGMKNIYLGSSEWPKDSIHLEGKETDLDAEFADPVNFDFRLQGTSRFRGAGPDKTDVGPYPFRANVFFVKPGGDDLADGLSLSRAWGTLARAVRDLRPGDTLYLDPGIYKGNAQIAAKGTDEKPIVIRGRGKGEAVVQGQITFKGSRQVTAERLVFEKPVIMHGGGNFRFFNCRLGGAPSALVLQKSADVRIEHCVFAGFTTAGIQATGAERLHLSSNIFDNSNGVAIAVGAPRDSKGGAKAAAPLDPVVYSDYNVYAKGEAVISGAAIPALAPGRDGHSTNLPELAKRSTLPSLGALGKPAGLYRDDLREGVFMSKPTVHSTTDTTANLEWIVSDDLECKLAWGETSDCENTVDLRVANYGSYSLTGLSPDTKYYFQIRSLRHPLTQSGAARPAQCGNPEFEVLSFTTASKPTPTTTYYVAPDGDDSQDGLTRETAWRNVSTAASRVIPGDTVLIAGGTYTERVRVRNTGEKDAPITFRSLPGERVEFSSGGKVLEQSWVINGKSHIRLDGFYFGQFRSDGGAQSSPRVLSIYESRDIQVSRCLSNSRGSNVGAGFVTVRGGENIKISNCVTISSFNAVGVTNSDNFQMEHCVLVVPMIQASMITANGSPSIVQNNIFTCNSAYKEKIWLQEWKGNVVDRNNAYFPRVPDDQKKLFWVLSFVEGGQNLGHVRMGLEEYRQRVAATDSLIADPQFAGLIGKTAKSGYLPDAALSLKQVDFHDFFTTNPELLRRGIGLQEDQFEAFHFNKGNKTAGAR